MDYPSKSSDEMRHINTHEELEKDLKEAGNKLLVVMFYAHWCAPSLMMLPIFEAAARSLEYKDCVFVQVNTNKSDKLADALDIDVIPSFFFYRNGEKIDELLGANEDLFKEKMANNNSEQ